MTARPRDHVTHADLLALADLVARWADERPCVAAVYLYGSRVRGDHRPTSDVDIYVQRPEGGLSTECLSWWLMSEEERFGSLRAALLPLPIHLGSSIDDPARGWTQDARWDPSRVVLRVGKVACLWMASQRGDVVT